VTDEPLPTKTEIAIESNARVRRFFRSDGYRQIKRSFTRTRGILFRDNSFPAGCYLMTGTGIVRPDNFTLQSGDKISITIAPNRTLVNVFSSIMELHGKNLVAGKLTREWQNLPGV